jgi:hypothetical protein
LNLWALFAEYIHWTSFALDPRFRHIGIDVSDFNHAEYFLDKYSANEREQEEVRDDLTRFQLKQDIFSAVSIIY